MNSIDPNVFKQNTFDDGHSSSPDKAHLFFGFGVIPGDLAEVAGMRPIQIRLFNGTWKTVGIAHILEKHGAGLALMGYWSVQDYVSDVMQRFNAVYRAEKGRWIISIKRSTEAGGEARERLLILDDGQGSSGHYSIVSGWAQAAHRAVNGELIAESTAVEIGEKRSLVWGRCASTHKT